MKIMHMQCHAGISGDMFLSALLDCGINHDAFHAIMDSAGVHRDEVIISKVVKRGITSTSLRVVPRQGREHLHVEDIRRILAEAPLNKTVIENALHSLELIVRAESTVHGVPFDHVHLHEVSGLDTIVDLLGVAWAMEHLCIGRVFATPVNTGSGTVTFSHGVVPVPAPATALILQGIPVVNDGLPGERTTPTGAALAATFIDSFEPPGQMIPRLVGYGAGERDDGDRANVLRVVIGDQQEPAARKDEKLESLVLLETDLDDENPEIMGFMMEMLPEQPGILDASLIGTIRKKGRPGFLLRILCSINESDRIRKFVFAQTSTLGIRETPVNRYSLARHSVTVQTQWGPVRVKCAGDVTAPEYEDCRAYAKAHNVPLRQVYAAALALMQGTPVSKN